MQKSPERGENNHRSALLIAQHARYCRLADFISTQRSNVIMNSSGQNLPPLFLSRLKNIIDPPHLETVLDSFQQPKNTCFRITRQANPNGRVVENLKQHGIDCQPFETNPNRFFVDANQRSLLTQSSPAINGQIYIQNISSMIVVDILDPQPGEQILDLAAAPGGKTLLIAEQMAGNGYLAAVEAVRKRFFKLQANLKQYQAEWVKTFLADGRSVGHKTLERFDRVLLDAPCSSEARFSGEDPSTWENWSLRKIRESARKQCGLIRSAFRALKPGGTLVYCTCSFAPEENEKTVDHLLKKFSGLVQLLPIELPGVTTQPGRTAFENLTFDTALEQAIRIIPDQTFNGMFVTKITKLHSLGEQTGAAKSGRRPKRNR
jgi:16S rRNA C967 or C1407 C5-methylase (RsmB/RsmF family)